MAAGMVSNVYNFSRHRSNVRTENLLIHQHECFELYYIVSGNLHFIYDGTEYALSPHTMILIAPDALHGIQVMSEETYERYTFHFVPGLFPRERRNMLLRLLPTLETVRSRSSPIPFFLERCEHTSIRRALDTILNLPDQQSDPETQRFFASSILEGLLINLYLSQAARPSFPSPRPAVEDPAELAPVLDYLRRHPSDRVSLTQLSDQFFISRSQLNNLFQRYFHTSVMDYITSQRLAYARKLLLSGMSAAEVASNVGYGDYSTFYRAYHRHFGHSPTLDKGSPGESGPNPGWVQVIPFAAPEDSSRAEGAPERAEFPDISFENNAYDPLE